MATAASAVPLASPTHRIPARCRHFGICGGCLWQDMDYAGQTAAKDAAVARHLRDVVPPSVLRPIVPARDPWFYRNKMEFAFAPPAQLGLHERGQWRRIVNLEECFLQSPAAAAIVRDVRAAVAARGLSCYDARTGKGLLRTLVMREARGSGEAMVGFVTSRGPFPGAAAVAAMLATRYPQLTSIVRGIVGENTSAITDVEVLHGRDGIVERVAGLRFQIGLTTFFQANTAQAEGMIALVDEFAALNSAARVVDLYCGVGTFALALARRARQVVGIDVGVAAIQAARANAALNGIRNADFYAASSRAVQVLAGDVDPDVVVLDPPRAGAGPRVMDRIAALRPDRIVYVSCNPATLGADLRILTAAGYAVTAVQPVDQFPQTPHVECIVQVKEHAAA